MLAYIFKPMKVIKKQLIITCLFVYAANSLSSPIQTHVPVSVFADLLYWHASEQTSSSWAYIPETPNISAPNTYFNWRPGVRTGINVLFSNTLNGKVSWTYFSTKTQAYTNAGPGQTVQPEFFSGFITMTPFTSGNMNWQLNMNMFDLEISHTLPWRHDFTTRPYLGIKGGTIYQNIQSNWQFKGTLLIFPIDYNASEHLINHFSGVGPSFGLDNAWHIYKNLNLRGDITAAWLWGHWKIQDIYNGPSLISLNSAVTNASSSSNSLGAYMLRYFAGIDWTYQAQATYNIKVGYEMQFWLNQLRIPVFQQVPVHGDLTLQGLTCGLLIKF